MAQATDPKDDSFGRLVRQVMPLSKKVFPAELVAICPIVAAVVAIRTYTLHLI